MSSPPKKKPRLQKLYSTAFIHAYSFLETDIDIEELKSTQLYRELGLKSGLYNNWDEEELESLLINIAQTSNPNLLNICLKTLCSKSISNQVVLGDDGLESLLSTQDEDFFMNFLSIINKNNNENIEFPKLDIQICGSKLLEIACELGREDVVKILLEDESIQVDPSLIDIALENEHEGIVYLLMSHLGINVSNSLLNPLNKIGLCECCHSTNVELFANSCNHETCENCTNVCGVCNSNICLLTQCMIPLNCTSCENEYVACFGCAYNEKSKLISCSCGNQMTLNQNFEVNYDNDS